MTITETQAYKLRNGASTRLNYRLANKQKGVKVCAKTLRVFLIDSVLTWDAIKLVYFEECLIASVFCSYAIFAYPSLLYVFILFLEQFLSFFLVHFFALLSTCL